MKTLQRRGGAGMNYLLRYRHAGKTYRRYFSYRVDAEREGLDICESSLGYAVSVRPLAPTR